MIRGAIAALLALALATGCSNRREARPEPARPLMLLTALPLVWGERFGLERPDSPVLARLEDGYRVRLIDLPEQLPEKGLLLAAQPRALPAEQLVRLDRWVRRGGRLLLLADPMLEWPSGRPFGDLLRPPLAYPDTGLLGHWGLRLDAPDERGPAERRVGGTAVLTASPGTLVRTGGGCRVEEGGLVARCQLGLGAATVIADADFLNIAGPGALDGPVGENVELLLAELKALAAGG